MTSNNPSDATVSEALLERRLNLGAKQLRGVLDYGEDDATALYSALETMGLIDTLAALSSAREQPVGDEGLRSALGWFIDDERFQVAVGGNPNVVDRMLAEARAIYLATSPTPDSKEPTHD